MNIHIAKAGYHLECTAHLQYYKVAKHQQANQRHYNKSGSDLFDNMWSDLGKLRNSNSLHYNA